MLDVRRLTPLIALTLSIAACSTSGVTASGTASPPVSRTPHRDVHGRTGYERHRGHRPDRYRMEPDLGRAPRRLPHVPRLDAVRRGLHRACLGDARGGWQRRQSRRNDHRDEAQDRWLWNGCAIRSARGRDLHTRDGGLAGRLPDQGHQTTDRRPHDHDDPLRGSLPERLIRGARTQLFSVQLRNANDLPDVYAAATGSGDRFRPSLGEARSCSRPIRGMSEPSHSSWACS